VILELTSVKNLEHYPTKTVPGWKSSTPWKYENNKGEVSLCMPRGGRVIDPLILNLDARGRGLVKFKTPSPYPQERSQAHFE
jgi:hypothetical protein